jgi:hypothetical protein
MEALMSDHALIQNQINALPERGGEVVLEARRYLVEDTIVLGNGSLTAPSTRNGIRLRGMGAGPTEIQVNPIGGATELLWVGPPDRPMVEVRGPVSGIRIEDLTLNGLGVCRTMLKTKHMLMSSVSRVTVSRWTEVGIEIGAWPNPTGCVDGARHNVWTQVHAMFPANNQAHAWRIGEPTYGAAPHLDVASNTFVNCYGDVNNGVANPQGGAWVMRFCDNLTFLHCQGAGRWAVIEEIPPDNGTWPKDCVFYNCPLGPIKRVGTHTMTNRASMFLPFPTGDGQIPPGQPGFKGFTDEGRFFGSGWKRPNGMAL